MKHCIIISLFCLTNIILFAQETITLSLEFITPSGKIDNTSYFAAKLQNHNDTLSLFVDVGGDGFNRTQRHSFLRVINKEAGGECMRERQPFFWYEGKNGLLIPPNSTWIVKLPLFFPLVGFGNGVLPPIERAMQNYGKVRIQIEEFTFLPLYVSKSKSFPPLRKITICSNWVDVPCEEIIEYLHH